MNLPLFGSQGEIGAIVQGGVRDVAHSRALDYPVWASDITPVTGKWRTEPSRSTAPCRSARFGLRRAT